MITATCGRASRASGAISPAWFMPISATQNARRAAGAPASAARPNGCCRTPPPHGSGRRGQAARSISLVVVLPTLPVTATSRRRLRTGRGRSRRDARSAGQRVVDHAAAGRVAATPGRRAPSRPPPLGQRVGDEVVAVAALAAQRDEQVARRQVRVSIDTPVASKRTEQRAAGRLDQLVAMTTAAGSCDCSAAGQAANDRRRRRTAAPCRRSSGPARGPCRPPPARRRGARSFSAGAIARGPVADLHARPGSAASDGGADRGRVLAARIVVGDDHARRPAARRRAPISGRLPRSRSPPAPNTTMQPARGVRTQRRQQPLQRVRRVGVVDIGGGAVRQRAASSMRPRTPVSTGSRSSTSASPSACGERRGHQRVVGLEAPGQRQHDLAARTPSVTSSSTWPSGQRVVARSRRSRCRPRPPCADRRPSPRGDLPQRRQGAGVHRRLGDRRRAARQQLREQPQLGGAIGRLSVP